MSEIVIEPREDEPEENKGFQWIVPECCREGWDDCPHVVNREEVRRKNNIGL